MMWRQPRVVIVGAGMSGLCQAILLDRAGFTDVTVIERASNLGGTWRDNRYPGLTCDVPSHLYQYSFDVNPSWSRVFSPGAEIQRYFEGVAQRHGAGRVIRYDTELADASHTGQCWQLTMTNGDVLEADFLILATGFLRDPRVPQFAGVEDFAGRVCHSARWADDLDVDGAKVAVIGNGSTGVQAVSAMAGVAEHVTLFQRTPQWVVRVPNPSMPVAIQTLMHRIPLLSRALRRAEHELFAYLFVATTQDGMRRRLIGWLCRRNLESVRDPALRAALTPDYQPMCRRLIVHPDFYQKVQRPDVSVVTSDIDRFEGAGIRTAEGRLHEVDTVVMATGFDAHAYVRPATVRTREGRTLDEVWASGPRAHKSVSVEAMPNMFMLLGPHSPIGNFSLIQIAEAQATYVVNWMRRWAASEFDEISPTAEAVQAHLEHIRSGLPGTVWTTGCSSWYLGADGLPELWTRRPQDYLQLLTELDDHAYVLHSRDAEEVDTCHVAT